MVDPGFDALVTRSGETGAETREKYQYQDAFGIHLLLNPAYNYDEIWCEIGDDFVAVRSAKELHAFQIKTTTGERRWRLEQNEISKSLKNFVDLFEQNARMKRFVFVSNQPVEDLETARSPKRLAQACGKTTSAIKLNATHSKSLANLAKRTGCKPTALFKVLQRTEFVTGPSYQDWRAAALECVVRYRKAKDLPGQVIEEWCDKLRGRFTEAASSKGERFSADRQKRRIGKEVLEETLAALLGRPSMLSAALGGSDVQALRRFDGSVTNFIGYYVGDEQHPKIFSGRESELQILDRWLVGGPQYLLVSSGAGLGKSALLVAWTRRALTRGDADIVFYPVSHRFQTNSAEQVFRGLYLKLCDVLGRQPASMALAGSEDWRKDFASLLLEVGMRRRTVVVVIDGLDEALDWRAGPDIFPTNPPANLRVLAAARPLMGDSPRHNWRTRLGWTRKGLAKELHIEGLDKNGVTLCVQEALPQLDESARNQVSTELMRLTSGDPLLLQFHLDSVDSTATTARELISRLRASEPGYEPFIENLFAGPTRENFDPGEAEQFFKMLAVALGPITTDELRGVGVSVPDFDSMNLTLRRLVVGDGVDQGFALSHPKLRDYFRRRAGANSLAKLNKDLIIWCRRVFGELLAGERPPAHVPRYVLRYFGAHLQNESDTEALVALAHERWAQAWLAAEVSYDGFLIDLRRAWDSVRAAASGGEPPDKVMATLVRLGMVVAKCRLPPISPELFVALVGEENWSPRRALEYARLNPRDEFFEFLADKIPAEVVPGALDSLLNADVGRSVITITPNRVRAAVRLLRYIAADTRTPFVDALKDKVSNIGLTPERYTALAHLLEVLDDKERADAAEQIAQQASKGKTALPFFFHEAIPAMAATLGADSPALHRVVHAGVMYAFHAAADADLDSIIAWFSKAGLAPDTLGSLADVAPQLEEAEWKHIFGAAERLVEFPGFSRQQLIVEFFEAALVKPPEEDRGRLLEQINKIVDNELEPQFRSRLLRLLIQQYDGQERQDRADALADLAIEESNATLALDAMESGFDFIDKDRQVQLIDVVVRDDLVTRRESKMVRLLPFLERERRQQVIAELIAAQRASSESSVTWLARYAVAFQFGDSAAELAAIRREHHLMWRDFISDVAWLPFGEAGPLLEIIDITYIDKVYSAALTELFAHASEADRTHFVADGFANWFQTFPPESVELLSVKMAMLGTTSFGEHFPAKLPNLLPFWPPDLWPLILAFLDKAKGEGDSLQYAIIAAAQYAPREYVDDVHALVRRLDNDEKREALAALQRARAQPPPVQDLFADFIASAEELNVNREIIELFLKLQQPRSASQHLRTFRQCLEKTQLFHVGLAKRAFRILHEGFAKLPVADRLPLLVDWFHVEANRGWDFAMRALANSAGMIAQATDAQNLRTIRDSIDEINKWFASVQAPSN